MLPLGTVFMGRSMVFMAMGRRLDRGEGSPRGRWVGARLLMLGLFHKSAKIDIWTLLLSSDKRVRNCPDKFTNRKYNKNNRNNKL